MEVPLFEVLADRWPGIARNWVLPPSKHWLGMPSYVEYDRAVVFDGSCGVAGCCGVVARIEVHRDAVTWSDFYAQSSPAFPSTLRYVFDRMQYEEAIARLPHAEPVRWLPNDSH